MNRERVQKVNHEAYTLLKDIGNSQNRFSPKVATFLQSVRELTKDFLSTPLNDWQEELGALRKKI
ncbi:hypothetical protein N7495_005835 [Penicillium taxi]|uniref:uncharacterized protein n=1 Tax=Penicillium taxi TaxID=168475 RepID=UPI0025455AB2|nr:uncharacterized protein N7495_005835 [Penicillium taxi]KAJ5894144.1 hypothetical protein N7495_005835 [Penicillium taxi]